MTISVAVAGASGYAGGELLRLVAAHSDFHLGLATANQQAGAAIRSVHPHLAGLGELRFGATDAAELARHDLVFLALPHGASAAIAAQLPDRCKVVDLGADFRLESAADWQRYYGNALPYAGNWIYGLPELTGHGPIAASNRVANPGCYATAIALAAAPLLKRNVVDAGDIVAVAASGTSGAGRTPSDNLLASEVMGSVSSYKTGGVHQHTPEIEQSLRKFSGMDVKLSFTPLLAPMSRGIHATVTAKLTSAADLNLLFADFYRDQPFVTVLPMPEQPRTSSVLGVNQVQLQALTDDHTGRAVVTIVLDNLVKGAAGQGIQNANIMFGLPETTGLSSLGIAP